MFFGIFFEAANLQSKILLYSQEEISSTSKMDRAAIEAQNLNGTQLLAIEVEQPSEAHRSPLGQLLPPASAEFLARDPLGWHLMYWLNIWVVGIRHYEDAELLVLWIEMEQAKIPDQRLRKELQNNWEEYLITNREESERSWAQLTSEDPGIKAYLEDIDTMLADKGKMRSYLHRLELLMLSTLCDVGVAETREFFHNLAGLYGKLLDEEIAAAEARKIFDIRIEKNKEEQNAKAIEEWYDTEQESSEDTT